MNKMIESPPVTVIIPSYNHARYVLHAIASVLRQTYENLDLLIIDDGSKDDSVKVVEEHLAKIHNHTRKITFIHRENRGLCNTLNQALEMASGEYVVTLASDDILLPDSISLMMAAALSDPGIAGVAGNLVEVDSDNNYVPLFINKFLSRNLDAKYISFEERFSLAEPFGAAGSLFSKKALIDVGGYRADTWVEDYYIHLELLQAGYRLYRIKDFVALYRMHGANSILATDRLCAEVDAIKTLFSGRPDYPELVAMAAEVSKSKKSKAAESGAKQKKSISAGFIGNLRNSLKNAMKRKYR